MTYWSGYCTEGLAPKETDIQYLNVRESPFKLYGLLSLEQDKFYRLPLDLAEEISAGVSAKMRDPAGIRVRFATDSPYIAIKAELERFSPSPHVTLIASKGFDLYIEEGGCYQYHNSFLPPLDTVNHVTGITRFAERKIRNIVINFPNGTPVLKVEVGIQAGSKVLAPKPYKLETPVVFYGSSITQGFAASRPGNTYENFISRHLDVNYINLGFSGNALGEPKLAEYISTIPMSAFVMDYDYNAPSCEHLKNTHYPFYKIIREKNPDLPIVLVTRPDGGYSEDLLKRREIIMETYIMARKKSDKNIHFVDGSTFFPEEARRDCTIDGCHPNDLGMFFIAKRIGGLLKKVLFEK